MMRLRLRDVKHTSKLQLQAGASLLDLQRAAASQLGVRPETIKLSLNNKVELQGAPETLLTSAGIISGDILWVLSERGCGTNESASNIDRHQSTVLVAAALPAAKPHTEPTSDAAVKDVSGLSGWLPRAIAAVGGSVQRSEDLFLLVACAALLDTGLAAVPSSLQEGQSRVVLQLAKRAKYPLRFRLKCSGQAEQPTPICCTLKVASLGEHVIIAGCAALTVRQLTLPLQQFLQPSISAAAMKVLHPEVAVHQIQDGSILRNSQQLWIRLKDELALPLAAALCAAGGMPSPASFLVLPPEIKQTCLSLLPARELAMLACVCAELRTLASMDALWSRLYQQEFGSASGLEAAQLQRQGWRHAFAAKWHQRQQACRRAMSSRHLPPGFRSGPYRGGPVWPPTRPLVAGGDYDRLPHPFLGGGNLVFPGRQQGSMSSGPSLGGHWGARIRHGFF